jgi:fused signal recognition particle receptor
MKDGLTKTRRSFTDGMVNILIGGKEIDDELLEEVEEQLLIADIGVDATKTIITNLTERTARGDLIYSHALYKALQEELVALLAPRKTFAYRSKQIAICDFDGRCKWCR